MTINPQFIYCHATGKPIAKIDDESYSLITMSLLHLDNETLEDELEVRTLSTMRPSVMWSSITRESIEYMRTAAPRELLAYLMNRMYAPVEHSQAKPITFESRISALRFRIQLWEIISIAEFGPDQLEQLLMILLELDTAFNLTLLKKPNQIAVAWSQDVESLIIVLGKWRDDLTNEQIKLARQARISADWWQGGNKLTRKAFSASALETKPLTRHAEKKIAKIKEADMFASILDALLVDELPIARQPTADFRPIAKRVEGFAAAISQKPGNVLKFGTGMKFGVKSNG